MPSAELKAIFSADTSGLRAAVSEADKELARLKKAGGGDLVGDLRGGENWAAGLRNMGVSDKIRRDWAGLGTELVSMRQKSDDLAAKYPTLIEQIGNTPAGTNAASDGARKLATELQNTKRSFLGVTNGTSEAVKQLLSLGTVMAAARFAKGAIDMADRIEEASQRTGMSIGNWQRLNYAASQTGMTMERVETSMRRIQDIVGGDVTDKQQAAFTRLGLSIEDLKRLSPDELFDAVAMAMTRIPDPTERAAAAVEIFGKSGTGILPMAMDLQKLKQQADQIGVVMSDSAVKGAAAFNDRLSALQLTVQATTVKLFDAVSALGQFWGTVASGRTNTTATKDEIAAMFGGAVTPEQIAAGNKDRRAKTGEKTKEEEQAALDADRTRTDQMIRQANLDRENRLAAAQQKAAEDARKQRAAVVAEMETAANKLADAKRKLAAAQRTAANEATVSRKSGELKQAEDAVKAAESRLAAIDARIKAQTGRVDGGTRVGRGLRRRSGLTYAEEAYEGMHETKGQGLTAGDRDVNWEGPQPGPLTLTDRRRRAQSALAAAESAKTRAGAGLEAARNSMRSQRADTNLETLAKAVTYWQQTAELLRQRLPGGA